MLDERGWELDDAGGAARAAVLPLRIEHEVVDDQLTTPLEQVEEADGAVRPVERVVVLDVDHGEIAPLGVDPVAHTGELLLLGQQRGARREPLLAGGDLGQAHRSLLTFVIAARTTTLPVPRTHRPRTSTSSESCLRVGSTAGQAGDVTTGRTSREADRSIVRCDGSIRVDVAGSSPVPRLRSQRGCEPPAMVSRIRLPRANRGAIGSSSNRTGSVGADGSSRSIPSATFREPPLASTSETRTNRSANGLSELWPTSATGVPATSSSAVNGSDVKVCRSDRLARSVSSFQPAGKVLAMLT